MQKIQGRKVLLLPHNLSHPAHPLWNFEDKREKEPKDKREGKKRGDGKTACHWGMEWGGEGRGSEGGGKYQGEAERKGKRIKEKRK